MSDPVRQLKTLGRDFSQTFKDRLPREFTKICFICVNSYRSFRQNIGVTPISDAVGMAKCVKYFEYEIYFVHNPHAQNFMQYLEYFLANTTRHLIVYYVGQGTAPYDLDQTIPRSNDDAFTFDDGAVDDEEFLEAIETCKHSDSRVTLVTDTCRCDTAWHIHAAEIKGHKLPPGVVTLSACPTASTSRQMMQRCQSQGIFTFNLTKEFKANPKITPNQLNEKMTPVMAEFAQVFSVGSSSPELLDLPILEPME
jgi:hypothetical protein